MSEVEAHMAKRVKVDDVEVEPIKCVQRKARSLAIGQEGRDVDVDTGQRLRLLLATS
jgi:hypothetical protein